MDHRYDDEFFAPIIRSASCTETPLDDCLIVGGYVLPNETPVRLIETVADTAALREVA